MGCMGMLSQKQIAAKTYRDQATDIPFAIHVYQHNMLLECTSFWTNTSTLACFSTHQQVHSHLWQDKFLDGGALLVQARVDWL